MNNNQEPLIMQLQLQGLKQRVTSALMLQTEDIAQQVQQQIDRYCAVGKLEKLIADIVEREIATAVQDAIKASFTATGRNLVRTIVDGVLQKRNEQFLGESKQ